MLLQQEQPLTNITRVTIKTNFASSDLKRRKSKPSRSPVMSFASNFQPLGTSDDQSFELIGALL